MIDNSEWLHVESLDLDAQGVAHNAAGKVVFIDDALPGEDVQVRVHRRKNNWEQGSAVERRRDSVQRVVPRCPHFGVCGGCKMQHLHVNAQVATKQRALEDALWHLGKVRPERVLRPIEGPAWRYRYRARLSVRHVAKKGTVLVGFHERKSSFVADMDSCEVVPLELSLMLVPLRELIMSMDQRDRLPQIEVAVGDAVIALVLRHLEPLGAADRERLRAFGVQHGVQWWLQPKGPDTVHRLDDGGPELAYSLPEFGITMPFRPTDFTQVNHAVNEVLVGRALRWLDARRDERVIDWFCGLGNFTLPIATQAREVLGIEGSPALVERARANAARNGLAARTRFEACNLFEVDAAALAAWGSADKWLIDPPREGAFAIAKALADLHAAPQPGFTPPRRIVYVSCNPATLARDAGLLVHQAGYRCSAAGAVNMFPQTAHVESLAVFDRVDVPAGTAPAVDAEVGTT
ncbi:23S rRNA (uracil(1939)-C(5))-methyltransferase RlmD [Piscinibacter koreensis]|uniref:23S rRNA (uracil(1939)-C(5))-methyltransferase RlmD n=1 Tax=Piscinibacter koreensis TaxID=2742824 RepID=A0A7Y6NR23_9BURK|nr:23S rRNA (uracil(1939)-C(5))-methyltransferase RlmD [Schlegelella koreensis]NUZ07763.1 23S rRNA (uracil(1939)-C(5))-methyltransferase RlmD [Schlegelella koreensis]